MNEELDMTIDVYNKYSQKYSDLNSSVDSIKEFLDPFITLLKKKTEKPKVLDIGCGPGRDMEYFANFGCRVYGVDMSKELIEIARRKVPEAEFYIQNMSHLNIPKDFFEGIWVCASFHHIKKKYAERTLTGFNKVLKNGGYMYICVKEGCGEKMVRAKQYNDELRFYSFYREQEFLELINLSNFKIITSMVTKGSEIKPTWINVIAQVISD